MTKALLTRLDQCQEFCFKILSSFIGVNAEAVAQNLDQLFARFEPVMLALKHPTDLQCGYGVIVHLKYG